MAGIRAARGEFVIMGDADDSYDFTALQPFVDELRGGADLVMGNRFRGGIAPGRHARPAPLRRQPGAEQHRPPVLRQPGAATSTAACAASGGTPSPACRCSPTGMEFASEMVVKATLAGLRIVEVPDHPVARRPQPPAAPAQLERRLAPPALPAPLQPPLAVPHPRHHPHDGRPGRRRRPHDRTRVGRRPHLRRRHPGGHRRRPRHRVPGRPVRPADQDLRHRGGVPAPRPAGLQVRHHHHPRAGPGHRRADRPVRGRRAGGLAGALEPARLQRARSPAVAAPGRAVGDRPRHEHADDLRLAVRQRPGHPPGAGGRRRATAGGGCGRCRRRPRAADEVRPSGPVPAR